MFKAPFSFKGRIRRTEFCLSYLIYFIVAMILQFALLSQQSESIGLVYILVILPFGVFLLAQGAKRCHDRGNSGWFQLIPFYVFWMFFADGERGINEYGLNPKGIGNEPEFSFEQSEIR